MIVSYSIINVAHMFNLSIYTQALIFQHSIGTHVVICFNPLKSFRVVI